MTTTELGACEWFVWDLRRSNLIDRGQLDQLMVDFFKKHSQAEPPALAQFLVDQGILSPFQADRLLQGKSQGLVLGPYTVVDALGSGSMGTVYKAQSRTDNRFYAIKVLPRRSMWNVRIARRQVRIFEQVEHPAVVPFLDVGTAGGTHYLAWPLVEGEPLDQLVQREGRLSIGAAAFYAMQAAEGLDACHTHNIVHGLLKPSNLMICPDGQIRILDLGIGSILANSEGESLVDTMSTANSLTSGLDCASPESIIEPTKRTAAGDQYSLGCVLYFCLAGRYPFTDCTAVEKMMYHQTKKPEPIRGLNPEVPEGLAAVIDRLMEKSPEARFSSMLEVMEAIQPFAASAGTTPVRPLAPRRRPSPMPAPRETPQGNRMPALHATAPYCPTPASYHPAAALAPAVASAPVPSGPAVAQTTAPMALRPLTHRIPNSFQIPPEPAASLEERVGPVGVFIGALMAACLTWLLSLWLFR